MASELHDVGAFMQTEWAWPAGRERALHRIGAVVRNDVAAWISVVAHWRSHSAFHLVPFAAVGFAINVTSGLMFLVSFPDQYV